MHQFVYTQKVLEIFGFDKAYLSKDPNDWEVFSACVRWEEILGPEFPYQSVVGVLMYLPNCTKLGIAFFLNLLAKYSFGPINRH